MTRGPKRTWTDEQFVEAARREVTISGVLRAIGLSVTGGNFSAAKSTAKRLGVDTSHWIGSAHLRGKTHSWPRKAELSDVFACDSLCSRSTVKRRLLRDGLLRNECALCGQGPEWVGRSLVMVLDHINGVFNDNRLENLRLLCPNCNSQTDTFASRNKRGLPSRIPKVDVKCDGCGKVLSRKGSTGKCALCRERTYAKAREIDFDILDYARREGLRAAEKMYAVGHNTIRKWMKLVDVPELA